MEFRRVGDYMYRIDLDYWEEGYGYSHTETFDNVETYCTAQEYIQSLEPPLEVDDRHEITVKVFNGDDKLVSSHVYSKGGE